jgi:AcrR family transcriptional regulator
MKENTSDRGPQTRADILNAAFSLITEQGYHGTSMRQIAEQAGIALGGIYNHFPSKAAVFEALIMDRNPYRVLMPAMIAGEGDTKEACFLDAARRMEEALEGRYEFLHLLFIEIVEFNGQHLSILFQQQFPTALQFMQKLQGLEGKLRPIPMPIMLRSFMGTFFSYVLTEQLLASSMPPEMRENALSQMIKIFLHGVLADDAPQSGDGV